jgi:hypothetical protein
MMCVEITDWMWNVRVVLSWSRIVWPRGDDGLDINGRELYSEYAGGRVSFSLRDMLRYWKGTRIGKFVRSTLQYQDT